MPLMLSPAPVIKAAFEGAPAPATAPIGRRSADNERAEWSVQGLKGTIDGTHRR